MSSQPIDPRIALANERTLLSWMRCALALVAAGTTAGTVVDIKPTLAARGRRARRRSRSASPPRCSATRAGSASTPPCAPASSYRPTASSAPSRSRSRPSRSSRASARSSASSTADAAAARRGRSRRRRTKRSADQVASIAQTLLSTSPPARPISRTALSIDVRRHAGCPLRPRDPEPARRRERARESAELLAQRRERRRERDRDVEPLRAGCDQLHAVRQLRRAPPRAPRVRLRAARGSRRGFRACAAAASRSTPAELIAAEATPAPLRGCRRLDFAACSSGLG